jgi:hypothetical protein
VSGVVDGEAQKKRVTLKGRIIAEIVAGNPEGRLKAIEYGSLGEIRRIEWEYEAKEDIPDV